MMYKTEDWDQTKYLPPQTNALPELDIVKALRSAWITVLKTEPSINSLAVLFAQITLECGPNLKYCHNYSVGNIKSIPGDNRNWTAFRCSEVFNGKEQFFDPPNPICNFRAFKTADEGFVDYIQFLAQRKNYAKAWQEVINGNPEAYSNELHNSHYYTANPILYTKGVVSIFNQFKSKYSNINLSTQIALINDKPIEHILTPDEIAHIQGQIALSLTKSTNEYFATSRTPENSDIDYSDINLTSPIPMPQSVWDSIKDIFTRSK